jgi:hypothetical protein
MSTCDTRDIVGPATLMNMQSPNLAVDDTGPKYTFRNDSSYENSVTFFSGGVETLRINDKGFWVRGQLVDQDDNEAKIVYNSFREWLTWQQLNRG